MPNAPVKSSTGPFRIFISHKIGGHGRAAEDIKHELENYAMGLLEVFVSPALEPGVRWRPEVLEKIETADLFILLYLVEGMDMDWCLYEAGYFEREARRTGKRLICMVNPGRDLPGPLEERQRLEADSEGVKKLLRAIYDDKEKPVRRDFFDATHSRTLGQLRDFVLKSLQPVKREPLCPRLWISLPGPKSLEQLKIGVLPADARLSGEAEALKQIGLSQGEEITVADFRKRSEFQFALSYYLPHLATCLRRIIERYPDLWIIPSISLAKGVPPKVLVPAYVEKGLRDSYRFEFLIYQPEPRVDPAPESQFETLCHLFCLATSFRKRIIGDWRERFLNLKSRGSSVSSEEVRSAVQKFQLTYGLVLLEALNRKIDAPRRIENCFPQKEDQDKLRQILDPSGGSYTTCQQQLQKGIDANDVGGILECLNQLELINQALLVVATKRLQELAAAMGSPGS
jgi:hypothetical protein